MALSKQEAIKRMSKVIAEDYYGLVYLSAPIRFDVASVVDVLSELYQDDEIDQELSKEVEEVYKSLSQDK